MEKRRCWTCPPACGTLAESRKKAKQYSWGIILQTTAEMEDEFDGEAIEEASSLQRSRFLEYCTRIRETGEDILPMGSSGFMLATGCELISPDAFDNARLMVDIAKTYGVCE